MKPVTKEFLKEQNSTITQKTCRWGLSNDYDMEFYETSCDNAQYFSEGSIKENKYAFCPYCGKPIEVKI
jgi:hypothetical protein